MAGLTATIKLHGVGVRGGGGGGSGEKRGRNT